MDCGSLSPWRIGNPIILTLFPKTKSIIFIMNSFSSTSGFVEGWNKYMTICVLSRLAPLFRVEMENSLFYTILETIVGEGYNFTVVSHKLSSNFLSLYGHAARSAQACPYNGSILCEG